MTSSPDSYTGVGIRRRYGVPGMPGPHHDVQVPVVSEFPHRLGVVRQERWRGAEESLVPGRRRGVIEDGTPANRSMVMTSGHHEFGCVDQDQPAAREAPDAREERCGAPGMFSNRSAE